MTVFEKYNCNIFLVFTKKICKLLEDDHMMNQLSEGHIEAEAFIKVTEIQMEIGKIVTIFESIKGQLFEFNVHTSPN